MNFLEITIYRIILKTYLFFEETGRQNSFERFSYLGALTERLTEECLDAWQHDTGLEAARYNHLLSRICGEDQDDNHILCNALDLCLAVAYVPEFSVYLNYYTGNIVTIQMALELDGITHASYNDILRLLQKLQKVCSVDWHKNLLPYAALTIDNALLSYLTGADILTSPLFSNHITYFQQNTALHPMFIRENYILEGAAWLQNLPADCLPQANCQTRILNLSGSGGRRFLAKQIAQHMKRDLILVDIKACKTFLEQNLESTSFWNELLHAAFLKNAIVCLFPITTSLLSLAQTDLSDLAAIAVTPFITADIPVILCTDTDIVFSAVSDAYPQLHSISLNPLTHKERAGIFYGFAALYQIPIDCAFYAVRYPLSASEIACAAAQWQHTNKSKSEDFAAICNTLLYNQQETTLGQLLYPSVGFQDLILPAHTKKTLEQICCGASEGYRIFEEWNLKSCYPYGRAVTVLLYGPPGTGKTMTAHAIAKELKTPLYQVDLSHVLDKYIGETEKHLAQIFSFAQKAKPVLFFDEADSLFGKRGEVTDGKDRYANMEVSYILQRIEQFDGIVILATNLYSGIDKAFLRRMKYVLKYQSPDAAMRRSIWENCLPPELPCEDLDLDYLAKQFDFTGGIIKNVIYTACIMAVHDNKKLCMEHILYAVRAEYEKLERPVIKDMWGEYEEFMLQFTPDFI